MLPRSSWTRKQGFHHPPSDHSHFWERFWLLVESRTVRSPLHGIRDEKVLSWDGMSFDSISRPCKKGKKDHDVLHPMQRCEGSSKTPRIDRMHQQVGNGCGRHEGRKQDLGLRFEGTRDQKETNPTQTNLFSTYSMAFCLTISALSSSPCSFSNCKYRLKRNFIFLGGRSSWMARSKRDRVRSTSPCLIS